MQFPSSTGPRFKVIDRTTTKEGHEHKILDQIDAFTPELQLYIVKINHTSPMRMLQIQIYRRIAF